jgi:hypothetical protein
MQKPPERGDLVEVKWADIYEDSTGDPDKAALAVRTSYGLFWGRSESAGIETVVTTTTQDDDTVGQSGFCCYPSECVIRLTVVRRKQRSLKRRRPLK